MNKLIQKKPFLINKENIIIAVFFLIVFSFQFHVLWLFYDILALGAFYFFIKNTNIWLSSITILSSLYFLFLVYLSGFHIISFLSIWDNGKHLFVLFMLFKLIDRYDLKRNLHFATILGYLLGFIFIVSTFLVVFQSYQGYHVDDVSGTFGYGGADALGYFCILYITYLLYIKRSNRLFIFVTLVSFILNYLAENMGFYVLYLMLVGFNFMNLNRIKYLFLYGIGLILFIFVLDIILAGDFIAPMLYRFNEYVTFSSFNLSVIRDSRGFLTIFSFLLGGFFGNGPGAYSPIYSMTGWLSHTLAFDSNLQINISSVTNLISEYGLIGCLLWLYVYLSFINHFFFRYKEKIFVAVFFTSCMLYNRLLMDERIIFILILVFSLIKIHVKIHREKKNFNPIIDN